MHILRCSAILMLIVGALGILIWANIRKHDTPPPSGNALYEIIAHTTGANLKVGWQGYGWPLTACTKHHISPVTSWNLIALITNVVLVIVMSVALALMFAAAADSRHSV